ncbi:MAG TPA: DUF5655 domain-containing protein [Bryobacteraceae bacterium]|nr:DUF4287 domain-containing protein [Bryobacterales bacterium]HRJ19362.1 DUF5655 domain-containing protein [Bryobacteraceae bacterium]
MSDPQKALATQLSNIEAKTGKSLAELKQLVQESGLEKHGAIRDMLKEKFGLGYGDANTLAHIARQAEEKTAAGDDGLASIYAGPKAALRPVHDAVMAQVKGLGEVEIAPKKTYWSLRRKKQFAMVGPATNTRVEVGLNLKDATPTARLEAMPPKSMCTFKVKLTGAEQVDGELLGWLKQAFDEAG